MKNKKTIGAIAGTLILGMTIALAAAVNGQFNISSIRSKASDYTLTLDAENGITGNNVTTNQSIATDSGAYQVNFAYNNCSSLSNGHATILAGGSIVNSDHILSIYSINASFETSGSLRFRTSYDGATWGTYTPLSSGVPYNFTSNPYYVEFATDGANQVKLNNVVFSYTCDINPDAQGLPSEENGFTATDENRNNYFINNIFDEDNALEVKALYTDGSEVLLNSTEYTYTVSNGARGLIDTSKAFGVEGEYLLTVNYKNYPAVQIPLTVTQIHVIDITLNTDLIRIRVGETAQLSAAVNPTNAHDQSINWTSSNDQVLTVSATGLVTGVSVGEATVTATSSDGNHTATCDFYVKKAPDNSTATIVPHYTGDAGYGTNYKDGAFTTNGIDIIDGQFGSVYGMAETSYLLYAGGSQAYMILYFSRPYILRGITVNARYYSRSSTLQYITDVDSTGASLSINSRTNKNFSYSGLTNNTTPCNAIAFIASGNYGVYINSITLTLYDAEARFPTQIYLEDTNVSLGYTAQLEPTFMPADTDVFDVEWTSSNEDVAYVTQSGLVYGFEEGTATITASLVNEYGRTISGSCTVHVVIVPAQGLSIYAATNELCIGQTTQLHGVFTPSDTTNKNVTWSSSNSNVATVNADGVVTGIRAGSVTITGVSVDGGFIATTNITVKNEQLDAYTVLIYMCGSDLESGSGHYASADLAEIAKVNCPSNVNLIIETGGSSSWSNSSVSATQLGRFYMNGRTLTNITNLDNASMGSYEVFEDFVEWGLTNYPAHRYGLIMWNHGGAMEGVCSDENFNGDSLYNSEVYYGVDDARILSGVADKLDFIAYDACLMAVQDIAETNSHNFKYMMASQESESGTGYAYDKWLPTLYNNPTTVETSAILNSIMTTFMAAQTANNQTQAVYDLSYMPAYFDAFEALAAKLRTLITTQSEWDTFANLVNQSKKYGQYTNTQGQTIEDYNNGYLFDVFDVGDFITNMQANSSPYKTSCASELSALSTAFNQLVIYESHGSSTSGHGLNMFCPISGYEEHDFYDQYETNFINWLILCYQFGTWYD